MKPRLALGLQRFLCVIIKNMEHIKHHLLKVMSKKGLGGAAISSQICYFAKIWAKGRFKPISFSRGTLKVSVRSSAAAQELSMQEEELVAHLNSKIVRPVVKRVRFENHS